jgi:hypothetical protein
MQNLKMMVRKIILLSKCNKIHIEQFLSEFICSRFRATTKYFVYISRYEKGELEMIEENSTLRVKGQFSKKFERKKGGDYIRTVGYTVDENGSCWICQPLYRYRYIGWSLALSTLWVNQQGQKFVFHPQCLPH